jgi:hypothetical protein
MELFAGLGTLGLFVIAVWLTVLAVLVPYRIGKLLQVSEQSRDNLRDINASLTRLVSATESAVQRAETRGWEL